MERKSYICYVQKKEGRLVFLTRYEAEKEALWQKIKKTLDRGKNK